MTCTIDIQAWEANQPDTDNIFLLEAIQDINFKTTNLKLETEYKKDISDLLKQKIKTDLEKIEKRLEAYINVIEENKVSINKYVVNPFIYNKIPSDWEYVYPDIEKPKKGECELLADLESMKFLPMDENIVPVVKEKNIFEKYKWYFAGGLGILVVFYFYSKIKRDVTW